LNEQTNYERKAEVTTDGKTVHVKKETDDGYLMLEADLPALITVTKPAFEPRMPKVKDKMRALRTQIPVLTAADLEVDPARLGLKGSPTKVKKTFVPQLKTGGQMLSEATPEAAAKALAGIIASAR